MLLVMMGDRRYAVIYFSVPVLEKEQAWLTYQEGFFDRRRCNFTIFRISNIFKCCETGTWYQKSQNLFIWSQ